MRKLGDGWPMSAHRTRERGHVSSVLDVRSIQNDTDPRATRVMYRATIAEIYIRETRKYTYVLIADRPGRGSEEPTVWYFGRAQGKGWSAINDACNGGCLDGEPLSYGRTLRDMLDYRSLWWYVCGSPPA